MDSKIITRLGFASIVFTICYFVKVLMEARTTELLPEKNIEMIKRNSKRNHVDSYRIDNKNSYTGNFAFDLRQEIVLNLAELDRRTVIVSGYGQNDALNGLGMIASIQAHMPDKQIIIYDLGIDAEMLKDMQALCNVEVRTFPYEKYPIHIQDHENGAWKLLVIMDLLKEYGAVFFASYNIRLRAPIHILLPLVKDRNGIAGKIDHRSRVVDVTHPSVYHMFNLTHKTFTNTFPNSPILSGDSLLLVNNSAIYSTMLQPLRECALTLDCIAPVGSTRRTEKPVGRKHTHRYEMSAFTLLMYRNFGGKWLKDSRVQALMHRIHTISPFKIVQDYKWAHYCNPPKREVTDKMK